MTRLVFTSSFSEGMGPIDDDINIQQQHSDQSVHFFNVSPGLITSAVNKFYFHIP